MNYQTVRAPYEAAINTACAALVPAIPVYFDNATTANLYSTAEFVTVNLSFGLTTEVGLAADFDHIRGSLVCRVYTQKGKGPSRNQTVVSVITSALQTLTATPRAALPTVLARITEIEGPTFSAPDGTPHFIGRFSCGIRATVYP